MLRVMALVKSAATSLLSEPTNPQMPWDLAAASHPPAPSTPSGWCDSGGGCSTQGDLLRASSCHSRVAEALLDAFCPGICRLGTIGTLMNNRERDDAHRFERAQTESRRFEAQRRQPGQTRQLSPIFDPRRILHVLGMISPDQVTKLIEIDEQLCTGCRKCVDACHEGAIQLIGGKAKLVKAEHCDGLGACIGECPAGALKLVERPKGLAFTLPPEMMMAAPAAHPPADAHPATTTPAPAPAPAPITPRVAVAPLPGGYPQPAGQLATQLHLVNPAAPCFNAQCHLLLAAHCSAFALGGFHGRFLAGKTLVICCPKLLQPQERMALTQKLAMILAQRPASLTIVRMQVPCCGGLVQMAQDALAMAQSPLTPHIAVVGIQGDVLTEDGPAPEAPAGVCPCHRPVAVAVAALLPRAAAAVGLVNKLAAVAAALVNKLVAAAVAALPLPVAVAAALVNKLVAVAVVLLLPLVAVAVGLANRLAAAAVVALLPRAAVAAAALPLPVVAAAALASRPAAAAVAVLPRGRLWWLRWCPAGGCGCEGGCAAKRDGQPCSGACGAKQCGGRAARVPASGPSSPSPSPRACP
ncbi:putative 4Fe-4S ferredoxin [Paratrimastix pyriformis]|uniref:4Fe-4S ferredoxin n=1 Tax=Paratrimastix pyriformis TaxID=342808 RepID=A0ABQ8UMN9_9EUKA|nr:putative 4Fe-4S ferredoxin [Paratrimastix pyriformis]